jgi:predicted HTH transcriptional regulator
MSQIAPVPSLYSLQDWPAFKRAKANLATRGAETDIDEAFRMVDTFASYCANSFVVTKTEREWPGQKKAKWGKHDSLESLREKLPAIVRTAAIRHPVKILDFVRDQGRVTTRDMVREFGASPNPFKATLTSLVEKGLLMRHGAGRSTWYGLP